MVNWENEDEKGMTSLPRADAPPQLHEVVLALLENEARGRILDMGCGEGALAYQLAKKGFKVYACDISNDFKLSHILYTNWDLNSGIIPYERDFFDYVCCLEVIEHLENPHDLIRKIRYILKPEGKLILTTPNICSLSSRIRFLRCGWFNFFAENVTKHINPLPLWELERILTNAGFAIEEVKARGFSKTARILRICTFDILFTPRDKVILEGGNIVIIANKIPQAAE